MGAALRDIKRKVRAIEKTKQITRAMNMVSASKLKFAQTRIEDFRPYAEKLLEVLSSLSQRVDPSHHPFLAIREVKRARILLVTSDRGLCGGFNTNVIRVAERLMKDKTASGVEVELVTIGKKGRDSFRKKRNIVGQYIDALRRFDIGLARRIADETVPAFLSGAYDELYIVFNEFRSVASQKPKALQILPVPAVDATGEEPVGKLAYVYEPSEDEILSKLLPAYVVVSIYRGLLETSAGEHGARMVAMDNATKSCQDFIETLTLQFNKARQSAITAELMDIVGGTEALAKAQ